MTKGIVLKSYFGINPGDTIYIDLSGKIHHSAIGIYNSEKNFILYTWDEQSLNECVAF